MVIDGACTIEKATAHLNFAGTANDLVFDMHLVPPTLTKGKIGTGYISHNLYREPFALLVIVAPYYCYAWVINGKNLRQVHCYPYLTYRRENYFFVTKMFTDAKQYNVSSH